MRFGALLALALLIPACADGAAPSWKRGAALPLARGEVAAAVAEGRIYVVGGWNMGGKGKPSTWFETGLMLDLKDKNATWKSIPQPLRAGRAAMKIQLQMPLLITA